MAYNYNEMKLNEILESFDYDRIRSKILNKIKIEKKNKNISESKSIEYEKDLNLARQELFLNKNDYIPPLSKKIINKMIVNTNLFNQELIILDSIKNNRALMKPNKKKIIKQKTKIRTEEDKEKENIENLKKIWGETYDEDKILRFQQLYSKYLLNHKGKLNDFQENGLRKHCRYSVLADLSTNIKDISEYEKQAAKVAQDYGLEVGSIEEDISKSLFISPDMAKIIEESVEIVPDFFEWDNDIKDDIDFAIFCNISYQRMLEGKSQIKYIDLYEYKYKQFIAFCEQLNITNKEDIINKYKKRLISVVDVEKNKKYYEPLLDIMNKENILDSNEDDE